MSNNLKNTINKLINQARTSGAGGPKPISPSGMGAGALLIGGGALFLGINASLFNGKLSSQWEANAAFNPM